MGKSAKFAKFAAGRLLMRFVGAYYVTRIR
jgi:hypothetical protein